MYIQDSQLKGLYQRKRTTGNKWVVKAKQRGINKPVTVTLGRVEVIPVRDARRLAREKLALLAKGINPNTPAKQSRVYQPPTLYYPCVLPCVMHWKSI